MYHYRPTISGRQLRIFIAAFAAIVAHIGLISLAIDQKPDLEPQLSLPRSVNVFLGQSSTLPPSSMAEKELLHEIVVEKPPLADMVETKNSIVETIPVAKDPEIEIQENISPELTVKPLKKIPVEKKQEIHEEAEPVIQHSPKVSNAEVESPANKQPIGIKTDQADIPAGEGVELPGALQLAHPRYQLNSPPVYPGLARKRGQQGTVILQVLVNREGRVEDLKIDVSSKFPRLDRAAIKAVKKWMFEPGRRDVEKVVMWVKVPVTFKLNNQ